MCSWRNASPSDEYRLTYNPSSQHAADDHSQVVQVVSHITADCRDLQNTILLWISCLLLSVKCKKHVCDECVIFTDHVRPMSHLRFYRSILSCNFIAQQICSTQLCMSHTATLSHNQELTSQCSPHYRDKIAQNRVLVHLEKKLHNCWEVARHTISHLRFCRAIKLRDKVAR